MEELSEIPISNNEVLRVLKARDLSKHHKRTVEMIEYLEKVNKNDYPMGILRNIKLDTDLTKLIMLSNTSDTSLVSLSDLKKIEHSLK